MIIIIVSVDGVVCACLSLDFLTVGRPTRLSFGLELCGDGILLAAGDFFFGGGGGVRRLGSQ